MPRFARVLVVLCLLLVATGCPPNRILGAQRWAQFHADGPNQGFTGVHSSARLQKRWDFQVGPVGYASPVLGPDGTVYVANLNGQVMAVTPAGALRWTATPAQGSTLLSSPAVADDGAVYVVSSSNAGQSPRSTLHRIDPTGQVRWSFPLLEGFTSASPKLLQRGQGVDIFLYVRNAFGGQLAVVNQDGQLLQRQTVCGARIVGGYTVDLDQLLTFLLTGIPLFKFSVQGLDVIDSLGWPDPTVAVIETRNVAPAGGALIVAANNDCSVAAYDWTPPTLHKRWEAIHDDDLPHSSAVVGGMLAVGRKDGRVVAYSVQSGAKQWELDLGEPIQATPSVLGIQFTVASRQHLSVIDFNGNLLHQMPLPGSTAASPALTLDRAYVSTEAGVRSFALDLQNPLDDASEPGGTSSPAVAEDGTIYAVTTSGLLRAYARQPSP